MYIHIHTNNIILILRLMLIMTILIIIIYIIITVNNSSNDNNIKHILVCAMYKPDVFIYTHCSDLYIHITQNQQHRTSGGTSSQGRRPCRSPRTHPCRSGSATEICPSGDVRLSARGHSAHRNLSHKRAVQGNRLDEIASHFRLLCLGFPLRARLSKFGGLQHRVVTEARPGS